MTYEFGRVHATELKDTVHIPSFENQEWYFYFEKNWGPKVVAKFSHKHRVSLTSIFMLVIRTKSHYQYLYIQKITHVFSNIHRNMYFHVSNTHIKTRNGNHQNQERALTSRLPSPSKPNSEANIYRRLTFRDQKREREREWEWVELWVRARTRVWEW